MLVCNIKTIANKIKQVCMYHQYYWIEDPESDYSNQEQHGQQIEK